MTIRSRTIQTAPLRLAGRGLAMSTLFLAGTVAAQPGLIADETGWSGQIAPLVGVISSRSNLAVSSDQKEIDSLYRLSSREYRPIGGALGRVDYTITPGRLALYAGTPRTAFQDGEISIEVGARYRLGDAGVLSAGVIPTSVAGNEVWSDPFVTGQPRTATDASRRGLHLGMAAIGGTGLSVDYHLFRHEIDEERSGVALGLSAADRALLDRDATEHRVDLNYRLPAVSGITLTPGLQYRRMDADGEANRGWLLRPQMTAQWQVDRLSLSLTGFYGVDRYDVRQPVYDEYRDAEQLGVVAGVRYAEPFGWSNWSVDAWGVWSDTDSDIRFYDQQTGVFAVGLGYRF
ncbi:DUF2860 family protein [Guyparkeria sp.]|uniref:DUF2860 family protein n=1 Tax=Guyparkeria sp. TaxID=2035736 RepID=UPI003565AF50